MDKEFTITETASKLNVTRQYIYKKLLELEIELKPYIIFKNNVKYLKLEGIEILKRNIRGKAKINTEKDKNSFESKSNNKENFSLTHIINNYESQIEYLKNELLKKDTFYNKYINDMNKRMQYFEEESKEKNKLLENMQVLLKEQKLLIEESKKKKWWIFKR